MARDWAEQRGGDGVAYMRLGVYLEVSLSRLSGVLTAS